MGEAARRRARAPTRLTLPKPSDAIYAAQTADQKCGASSPGSSLTAYAQDAKPYYEVVFAVLTVPQHRPHRDAIRNGYGQPGGFRTKLWFVVSERTRALKEPPSSRSGLKEMIC